MEVTNYKLPVANRNSVLLLAHGTPDTPADVPAFLLSVTGGRPLPEMVVEEVKHRYGLIGRSPLRDYTERQAAAVQHTLGIPVYFAMRNWTPFVRDVVAQMLTDGIGHIAAICLAPQNSRTSVGLYRQALLEAQSQKQGEGAMDDTTGDRQLTTTFVDSWHDHPLLIKAFAEKLDQGWPQACAAAGCQLPVIFTAHSVPSRTVQDGDPYEQQARHTAELIAGTCSLPEGNWRFAFQSQGMSGGPWLGPTVENTITALKAEGYPGVFIQPIAFLCDHVEVLYDVDIAFRKYAEDLGMKLWRAESLNDSSLLTAAIADIARGQLQIGNL